jgi:hypothetical protein
MRRIATWQFGQVTRPSGARGPRAVNQFERHQPSSHNRRDKTRRHPLVPAEFPIPIAFPRWLERGNGKADTGHATLLCVRANRLNTLVLRNVIWKIDPAWFGEKITALALGFGLIRPTRRGLQ